MKKSPIPENLIDACWENAKQFGAMEDSAHLGELPLGQKLHALKYRHEVIKHVWEPVTSTWQVPIRGKAFNSDYGINEYKT